MRHQIPLGLHFEGLLDAVPTAKPRCQGSRWQRVWGLGEPFTYAQVRLSEGTQLAGLDSCHRLDRGLQCLSTSAPHVFLMMSPILTCIFKSLSTSSPFREAGRERSQGVQLLGRPRGVKGRCLLILRFAAAARATPQPASWL